MRIKYPKLPTGPSAVGAAGVRAIQATGGDWQQKRFTTDAVSHQQGEFQKIVTGGVPEYVSHYTLIGGTPAKYPAYGPDKFKEASKLVPSSTFMIHGSDQPEVVCGDNVYLFSTAETTNTEMLISYGKAPGNPDPVFDVGMYLASVEFNIYKNGHKNGGQGKSKLVFTTTGQFVQFKFGVWLTGVNKAIDAARIYAMGTYEEKRAAFMVMPTSSRFDSKGRPIQDVDMVVFALDGTGELDRVTIPVASGAHAETEYVYPPSVCVTENRIHILITEADLYYGAVDPGRDYIPKTRVLNVDKTNISSFAMADAGAIGMEIYHPVTPITAPGDPIPWWYPSQVGHVGIMQTRYGLSHAVALEGDASLHFWEDAEWGPLASSPPGNNRPYTAMCIKVSGSTATVTLNLAEDFPALNSIEYTAFENKSINDAINIGGGYVLAKLAHIIPRQDARATFLLSSNSGGSWTQVTPTGFAQNPSEGQYFGRMTVHKARNDAGESEVMITSWDGSAYFIYASKDSGYTWKKAGKLKTPPFFSALQHWRRCEKRMTELTSPGFPDLAPTVTKGIFRSMMPGPKTIVDKSLPDRFK